MTNRSSRPIELRTVLLVCASTAVLLGTLAASAQDRDLSKVKQKVHQLSETIWWLEPQPALGGNLI